MNKKKIYNMTLFAVFASIIMLLGLVPNIGYITFIPGIASLTIIHIPVLIGIMFLPLGYALGLGFTFGLTSLIAAYVYGKTAFDFAFQNPIIAIVPRVLFSLAAYYIFHGFKVLFSKIKNGKTYSFIVVTVVTALFLYFTSVGLTKVTGWDIRFIYIGAFILLIGLMILYYYFLSQDKYQNLTYIPSVFITASLVHSMIVLTLVALMKPLAYGEGTDILGVILTVMSTNALFEALIAVLIGSPIVVALFSFRESEEREDDIIIWCR